MKPDVHRLSRRALQEAPGTGRNLRIALRLFMTTWVVLLSLHAGGSGLAAPVELGRLFYTPAQRAELESARTHNVTQTTGQNKRGAPDSALAPLRFDGVVIRSDGKTTRWVDGKPQVGASGVSGLKPGQTRADGKVYEPYQLLRPVSPRPAGPNVKVSVP